MSIKSLWPESFDVSDTEPPPVQVLEEQAKLLPKLTNDIVYAHVDSVPSKRKIFVIDGGSRSFDFTYSFFIKGKFVTDFSFEVFSLGHDINLYPVIINLDYDIRQQIFPNKPESKQHDELDSIHIPNLPALEELIEKVLKSEKIYRVITSIMKLSVTVT
jgi:hypothetical protein